MKRIYEYISCMCALYFSGMSILLFGIIQEINVIIIINAVLAIFCWVIFFFKYRKNKYLKKNAKFVWGKVVKDSVRYIPVIRGFSIIEALVTYYEPETERTLLFKGRYAESIYRYYAIKKIDGDIFVLVGYNPQNVKQYIVYLQDAVEDILNQ